MPFYCTTSAFVLCSIDDRRPRRLLGLGLGGVTPSSFFTSLLLELLVKTLSEFVEGLIHSSVTASFANANFDKTNPSWFFRKGLTDEIFDLCGDIGRSEEASLTYELVDVILPSKLTERAFRLVVGIDSRFVGISVILCGEIIVSRPGGASLV